jgi:hypothetical protein
MLMEDFPATDILRCYRGLPEPLIVVAMEPDASASARDRVRLHSAPPTGCPRIAAGARPLISARVVMWIGPYCTQGSRKKEARREAVAHAVELAEKFLPSFQSVLPASRVSTLSWEGFLARQKFLIAIWKSDSCACLAWSDPRFLNRCGKSTFYLYAEERTAESVRR